MPENVRDGSLNMKMWVDPCFLRGFSGGVLYPFSPPHTFMTIRMHFFRFFFVNYPSQSQRTVSRCKFRTLGTLCGMNAYSGGDGIV